MQHSFPHFGDREIPAVQGGIHMILEGAFGIGGRHAGKRDEPPIPPAQSGPRPDLAEDGFDQAVRCRGTGIVRRVEGHDFRELASATLRAVDVNCGHRMVTPASTLNSSPVTKRDSSDTRNSTALLISTASAMTAGR